MDKNKFNRICDYLDELNLNYRYNECNDKIAILQMNEEEYVKICNFCENIGLELCRHLHYDYDGNELKYGNAKPVYTYSDYYIYEKN